MLLIVLSERFRLASEMNITIRKSVQHCFKELWQENNIDQRRLAE